MTQQIRSVLPSHDYRGRVRHSLYDEQGVGLIEVMVALFILAFGALAIGNMQASALSAASISTSHFELSSLSEEILEHLKADPAQAGSGAYDTTFAESAAADTVPADRADVINGWKNRVANTLPGGATEVSCSTDECTVTLRWRETTTTGNNEQLYRLKVPLLR